MKIIVSKMGKYFNYPNCTNVVNDSWVNYKDSKFRCTINRLLYPTLIMSGLTVVITLAKIFKVSFSLFYVCGKSQTVLEVKICLCMS